ncbi:MAG: ABC-2 transporter permease [Blautia sp.]|nr:ABC-2 transporter permease [Lachnoclostridium sp.]MCM1212619.1 ABC-2 transporter permease [Blautia sp.]
MKGLLKNNFYAACASAKVFSVFMFLWGLFVVAVISPSLQIGFVLSGIIGFSGNALFVARNEFVSKWGKYKLTLPVRRADIVKSLFLNQIIWLLVGTLFVGVEMLLAWLLHGCPFDKPIDALSMLAVGISISLFMGALFFPLFYLGGEERGEVFLVIALLCAFGIDWTIVSVLNELLEPGMVTILLGAAVLFVSSLLAFFLSYLLTVRIFSQREY